MMQIPMQPDFFEERYPYNVQPRVAFDDESKDYPCKTCMPDFSKQFIILRDNTFEIVKGRESQKGLPLNNFFTEIDNFNSVEYTLPIHLSTEFSTISYGIIGKNNKISFISIFPDYTILSNQDQSSWQLNWRYKNETEWKNLGRILVLSSNGNEIPELEIQNRMDSDVTIKLLFASK
jgi:hypothetical protein